MLQWYKSSFGKNRATNRHFIYSSCEKGSAQLEAEMDIENIFLFSRNRMNHQTTVTLRIYQKQHSLKKQFNFSRPLWFALKPWCLLKAMVQKSIHRTNKPTLLNPFGETYLHLGNWWNPKLYPDPLGSIEAAHSLPQFSFSPILFGSKEKTSPFFLGLKFLSSPFVFGADATNPQKQKKQNTQKTYSTPKNSQNNNNTIHHLRQKTTPQKTTSPTHLSTRGCYKLGKEGGPQWQMEEILVSPNKNALGGWWLAPIGIHVWYNKTINYNKRSSTSCFLESLGKPFFFSEFSWHFSWGFLFFI